MRIGDLAQRIMDLYLQQFRADEEFFSLEDFVSQVKTAYTAQIVSDYEADKVLNSQIDGFSYVTLPVDVLKHEVVEVKKDESSGILYADLPFPVFQFPFDSMASGVQSVQRIKGNIVTNDFFVKVSINDTWKVQHVKHGNRSYFSVGFNKITFEKLGCNGIEKVRISYVPMISSLTEDDEISDTRADKIEVSILQKMLAAKEGSVADLSNNSNPNKALETEIDSNQMKK